jgi:hypothetical protein
MYIKLMEVEGDKTSFFKGAKVFTTPKNSIRRWVVGVCDPYNLFLRKFRRHLRFTL